MFQEDERRIEEERRGISRPAPATLASAHLTQALNALDDACTPETVWRPSRAFPSKSGQRPAPIVGDINQREFCCAATVFAAFAAEAYVNDFLRVHRAPALSLEKFEQIDRHWPTSRKYVEAVATVYAPLFWDGDEVMPQLEELIEARNQLAHARPGTGPVLAFMPDPKWRESYAPGKVAEWLIAVAGAAESMELRCYGFDYYSVPAQPIWKGRELVRERARQAALLPGDEHSGQTPLIRVLLDHIASLSADLPEGLTVSELRDARLKLASEQGPWDAFTEVISRNPPTAQDQ